MNTSVAIRILDASVLIYALRTVHEWLKRGEFRVVVPLEGEFTFFFFLRRFVGLASCT